MEDVKKYKKMENVLNKINQKYIALPDDEVRRNNKIVEQVVNKITTAMQKKNPLFNQMFERRFYGGSYYDGIKVGKPEEFDLDFVLNLPVLINPVLEVGDKPGFVQIHIMDFDNLLKQHDQYAKYVKLKELFDDKMYLSTEKVLRWMEKIVNLALNDFGRLGDGSVRFNVGLSNNENLVMHARISKCHPAFTLKLTSADGKIKLDVDLVPCFQFKNDQWPKGKYRPNPKPELWDKFLVVPKQPKDNTNCQNIDRYWRLSFQEQERELITGRQTNALKPALRLLKKLRDKHKHSIASYHIKTVFLWQVSEVEPETWRQPISVVFMMMLKKYAEMVKNKCIPYYWNQNFNMIGHFKDSTLTDIGNTLMRIISNIDRYVDEDPFVVAKYLLDPQEIEKLRREPEILGKKVLKKIASMNNSTPQPNIFNFPSEIALSSQFSTSALCTSLISLHLAEELRNIGVSVGDETIATSSDKGSTITSTSETGSGNGSQIPDLKSNQAVGITNDDNVNSISVANEIIATSSDKGSTITSTSETGSGNGSQIPDLKNNKAVGITNDDNVNSSVNKDQTLKDLEFEISYRNSVLYSSGQMSDESSIKIIQGCDCTDFGSSDNLSKSVMNNAVNESSDADVESSSSNSLSYNSSQMSDVSSIKTIESCGCTDFKSNNGFSENIVNVDESSDVSVNETENDKYNNQKSDVINDDGFVSGDSNNASCVCVSDNSDKEVGNLICDRKIYINLENLNEKTDVMSSVLKKLEDGHENLLNVCSMLSEKVQILEDRVDTMDKNFNAKSESFSEDPIPYVSSVDSRNKDCIDARFAGNVNETLEQLNKKTENIFDMMKMLQDSNEKLLTICQPLSERVQTLERKIDVLNKNVKPEVNSNFKDLLMFGAPVPSSSLTHDNAVLHSSDVFTGGY